MRIVLYVILACPILFDERTIYFAINRANPLFDSYAGFRGIELLSFALLGMLFLFGGFNVRALKRNPLLVPLTFMFLPIYIGIIVGVLNNNADLFGHWRNYVIGYAFFIAFIMHFDTLEKMEEFFIVLLVITGVRTLYTLGVFVPSAETAATRFGFGTPFFYNTPILFALIACSSYGLSCLLAKDEEARINRHRSILFLSSLVFLFVIILSFKRSIWGIAFVSYTTVFIMLLPYFRRYLHHIVLGGILVLGTGLVLANMPFFAAYTEHLPLSIQSMNLFGGPTGTVHDESNAGHIENISVAWTLLNEKGLFFGGGVGLIEDYRLLNPAPHNAIIFVWYKYGIIGLFVYLYGLVKIMVMYLMRYKLLSLREKQLSVGLFGLLTGWFFASSLVIHPHFPSFTATILIFTTLGMLSSILVVNEERWRHAVASRERKLA